MDVTNVTELLGRDQVIRLLHLCGAPSENRGTRPSDYDLLCHLLSCLPLFPGHEIKGKLTAMQAAYFPDLTLAPQNAGELWRRMSDILLMRQVEIPSCEPKKEEPPLPLPDALLPRDITHLLCDAPHTAQAWDAQLKKAVFESHRVAILRLHKDFSFVSPNPYHAAMSLQKENREKEDADLLACQLLREWHRHGGSELILEHVSPREAEGLCAYLQAHVGTPTLALSVENEDDITDLVALASRLPGVRLAVKIKCCGEPLLVPSMATVYPVGRILIY